MTAVNINNLRALLANATPGPWDTGPREDPCYYVVRVGQTDVIPPYGVELRDEVADAALIAAAVNALPSLLDEIERLRALNAPFDYSHPKTQALIASAARRGIALDIVRDLLEDDYEPTPIDSEHWAPIHDQVQAIKRERDELRAEAERLRADAARLDYIEKHARYDPKLDGNHAWWPTTFENQLRGPTLRAAIDAQMRGESEA